LRLLFLATIFLGVGLDEKVNEQEKVRRKQKAAKISSKGITMASVIQTSVLEHGVNIHAVVAGDDINDKLDDLKSG